MKNIFIAMIFIAISVKSFSQNVGAIKGKVIEQITKQPIVGANIVIENTTIGTVTDSVGNFSLNNIAEGNYTIKISSVGYQQKVMNDIIVVREKTYYTEVELFDAVSSLGRVTVKGFKNENLKSMPVSTYSFSREEISRNPGAQGDIFRAIGILPGVSSSGGQFSAIAVRGQGIRDNVYMVDDIPMFEVSHLEGSSSGFNDPNGGRFSIFAPRVVDNAVFQGGGFSAQFGRKSSSYLGLGIKEGNKKTATISGQFDLLGATLIYDGPLAKTTSLFATARYQNFSLLKKVVGLKNIGLPIYGDYMIKTTTQINTKNKLSFIAMYNPETYDKTINDVIESDKVEDISIVKTTNNKALIGLNLRTLISKNSFVKHIVYYRNLTSNNAIGSSFPTANANATFANKNNIAFENDVKMIKNNQTEIGYRSIFTQRFKNSTLTTGIDLTNVSIDYARTLKHTDTLYTFTINDFRLNPSQYYVLLQPQYFNAKFKENANNASAYLDYSFTAFKKLTLNAGVRYDYTGFAKQHTISPRLSGSLPLTDQSTINFAAGIFYQDPLLTDVADQSSTSTLKNEKTTQFILGYKNYFANDLKLVVETYYKQLDNLVTRPLSGQSILNNNGTGNAYGLDINFTKRLSEKYYGQIGYSFSQSKRNDNNGQGEYNYTYSQPHIFSLLASYKPNDKWIFSTKFRYATGRPKDSYIIHNNIFNNINYNRYSQEIITKNADRLNDFISFDVRADYRVQVKKTSITAFIDIVDLLNRFNQSSEAFQPITGKTYFDGLAIFPSFGVRLER
jgi:CarboxypepD_reg-like domain/TonB dependent receptor/TonB-dependent Receptor Plug Domain